MAYSLRSRKSRAPSNMSTTDIEDIFREPVWFIRSDERGVFECNRNVIEQLERIEKQLVVIAITGKYRTGKSYLMNRLTGQNKGFPLGTSIESKTKGIWIWCRHHPYRTNQTLVLLDTEGLGDIRKVGGRDGDTKIMTMAVLLSSCFVYNILSAFNTDALEKLEFVGHVAKRMSPEYFPQFVLAVRDFNLDLEDDNGTPITADQYLEHCLKEDPNENKAEINETRKFIRTCFTKRRCQVFERPCDTRGQLKELEKLTDADLNPVFKEQSDDFVARIQRESTVKKQNHVEVDGKVFCILVNKCVADINNGCVPLVDDMFTALVQEKNKDALHTAIQAYCEDMEAGIECPKTEDDFDKVHGWALDLAIETRYKSLGFIQPLDEYADKFEAMVIEKREEYELENEKQSINTLRTLLVNMYEDLSEELGKRRFHNEWGHDNYQVNMAELKQNFYFSTEDFGGKREFVFAEFVDSKNGIKKMLELNQQQVIDSKKAMEDEKQRAAESRKRTAKLQETQRELTDEMRKSKKSFKQKMDDSISQHGKNVRDLHQTNERRLDQMRDQMQKRYTDGVASMERSFGARRRQIADQRDRQERRFQSEQNRLQENLERERRRNNELKAKLAH